MKKIILFTTLLLSIGLLKAQPSDPATLYEQSEQRLREEKGYVPEHSISFALGLAMPDGAFGSIFTSDQGGFAKTGLLFSIDGTKVLKDYKNYGLAATVAFYTNGTDQEGYKSSILRRLPTGTEGEASVGRWSTALVAGGAFIALREKKWILNLRALIGGAVVHAPAMSFEGSYQGIPITDERGGDTSLRPTFVAGLGLSYPMPFWYDWRLFVKAETIVVRAKVNTMQLTDSSDYVLESIIQNKQNAGIFSMSIGLRYEFWYY